MTFFSLKKQLINFLLKYLQTLLNRPEAGKSFKLTAKGNRINSWWCFFNDCIKSKQFYHQSTLNNLRQANHNIRFYHGINFFFSLKNQQQKIEKTMAISKIYVNKYCFNYLQIQSQCSMSPTFQKQGHQWRYDIQVKDKSWTTAPWIRNIVPIRPY